MKNFRVIIVDDERLAREEVKRALMGYPDFVVVAEAKNADEAKEYIGTYKPELLFLDIQMSEKSGFDLLRSLPDPPGIVFTTAYNEYAVEAFETDALDYLVKPLRNERFAMTMEKVRRKLAAGAPGPGNATGEKVFIKDGNKCHLVDLNEVYLIESMDNYARLLHTNKILCIRRSLNQLEEILDRQVFFRISRTQIVNTSFIKHIYGLPKGKLQICLQDGKPLNVSSRQSVRFKAWKKL